jgi:hypothetical protein
MIEWKYEKYLWFSVRVKHRKILSAKNIFQKNDFPKTILHRNKRNIKDNWSKGELTISHHYNEMTVWWGIVFSLLLLLYYNEPY